MLKSRRQGHSLLICAAEVLSFIFSQMLNLINTRLRSIKPFFLIIKSNKQKEVFTRENCHITELLNDDLIPNLSLATARVEPNITTELHVLDVDEAYYILKGQGNMQIDGQSTGMVGVGNVVFISKGRSQQISNTGSSDLVFLCICSPRFEQEKYHGI